MGVLCQKELGEGVRSIQNRGKALFGEAYSPLFSPRLRRAILGIVREIYDAKCITTSRQGKRQAKGTSEMSHQEIRRVVHQHVGKDVQAKAQEMKHKTRVAQRIAGERANKDHKAKRVEWEKGVKRARALKQEKEKSAKIQTASAQESSAK